MGSLIKPNQTKGCRERGVVTKPQWWVHPHDRSPLGFSFLRCDRAEPAAIFQLHFRVSHPSVRVPALGILLCWVVRKGSTGPDSKRWNSPFHGMVGSALAAYTYKLEFREVPCVWGPLGVYGTSLWSLISMWSSRRLLLHGITAGAPWESEHSGLESAGWGSSAGRNIFCLNYSYLIFLFISPHHYYWCRAGLSTSALAMLTV